MGLFDSAEPFSESFKEGQFFTLLDAKVANELDTEYGKGTPVHLKIQTEQGPKWYSVFGQALVSQVGRMEPGELGNGIEASIVRRANKAGSSEYKVLATKDQVEKDEIPF